MTSVLQRAVAWLCAAGMWLAGVSLLMLIVIVCADILCRAMFGFSLLIADEYSGYLLIALTFMGGAYSLQSGSFTRMDALYNRSQGRLRWFLDLLIGLTGLFYVGVVTYWAWIFIARSYQSGVTSNSIAQTPLFIPQVCIGLGFTLLLIVALLQLVLLFRTGSPATDQTGS